MRRLSSMRLAVLIGLLSGMGCSKRPAWLPKDGDLAGLVGRGSPKAYRGRTLYAYMNGGADIFHEYGFRKLFVQTYEKTGREVVLECYEMSDDLAAAGIYGYARRPGSEGEVAPGCRGSCTEALVSAAKGKTYVVTRTGDLAPGMEDVLKSLCALVVSNLPGSNGADLLAQGFPGAAGTEGSVVYLKGPIGLRIRPWLAKLGVQGLADAWMAKCRVGERDAEVVRVTYASAEDAGQSFKDALSQATASLAVASRNNALALAKGEDIEVSALEDLVQGVLSEGK